MNPKGKNTIIGSIYKHFTITQKDFTNKINPLLININKENKPCFLSGDFNMNLLSIDANSDTETFFDNLTENQFMPLITIPTRIANNSKTLIDNIYFNQFSNDIISGNLTVGISDHMPQFSIIPLDIHKINPKTRNIYRRVFKNFNNAQFMNEINQIDWTIYAEDDVNDAVSTLLSVTDQLLDKYAPVKRLSKKQLKQRDKPWIDNDILKSIKDKDNIYRKLISEKNPTRRESYKADCNKRKNEITKNIRLKKKAYYKTYFQKHSQNAKKMWSGINEIIHTKSKNKNSPNCIEQMLNNEKVTITDSKSMSNAFNTHYVNVAEEILKQRKYPGCKSFTEYLKDSNSYTFMAQPTTPKEVDELIKSFDSSKSAGPNSIPNKVIGQISASIAIPISNIINQSLLKGIYPSILKISKVIPVHKKDSKLEIVNYRPISLLSNINKIIEKLMFNRLYSFLEFHNCIYDLQFGFREMHSTNHALMSMIQQIRDTMDDGNIAVGVFVDFQKAFDTVNHDILLRKLDHYGVRGISNSWFKSYLTDRKQYVSLDGTDSDQEFIKHGVPQGSVLGPLLFLIYINDLHQCIKHSTTRHFADDTNLLHILNKSFPNRTKKINRDLRCLNNWLLANKISLNSTKTEIIFFRKRGIPVPIKKIKLNGVKLLPSSRVKYVGITIDEHLTFEPNRKILQSKLKRANNLLSISRHYVPKDLLKQIYFGQFHSHLMYGSQIWGLNDNDNLKILTQQKKAIRKISFAHYEAHADPIFKELGILKLPDIIKMNNLLFVHRALNDKVPKAFKDYFKFQQFHNYNIRRNPNTAYSIPPGSLELPTTNLLVGQKGIRYRCASDWNAILKELARIHPVSAINENWLKDLSSHQLKAILKKFFLSNY